MRDVRKRERVLLTRVNVWCVKVARGMRFLRVPMGRRAAYIYRSFLGDVPAM